MLDLVLTNREEMVRCVKFKGSLGHSDHKKVEFKTLRAVRRLSSKLTTPNFRREHFGLWRGLLGGVPWHKALEGRAAQESCIILKDHLQAQKLYIPTRRKSEAQEEHGPA